MINTPATMKDPTPQQAQVLAFIGDYTTINGRAPAEFDIQCFFGVSPPSVHSMILRLEKLGFITRTPGAARFIRLLMDPDRLPRLKRWELQHPGRKRHDLE